jgi:hypothetical protein
MILLAISLFFFCVGYVLAFFGKRDWICIAGTLGGIPETICGDNPPFLYAFQNNIIGAFISAVSISILYKLKLGFGIGFSRGFSLFLLFQVALFTLYTAIFFSTYTYRSSLSLGVVFILLAPTLVYAYAGFKLWTQGKKKEKGAAN